MPLHDDDLSDLEIDEGGEECSAMEEREAHSGGRESGGFVAVGEAWKLTPMTEGRAVWRLIGE